MEGCQLSYLGIISQNSNDYDSIEPVDFWFEGGDISSFSHNDSPANTHYFYRQPYFEQNAWVSGPETGPTFRPKCHFVPSPTFSETEPDYFDPSISQWPSFIAHFEHVAFSNRWSECEKAERLITCLRGDAENILSELTYFQCTTYTTLKKALNQMFGRTQREIEARDEERMLESERRNRADLENALNFYIERCQTLAEQIEEAIEIKLNQLKTSFANYKQNKHFSNSNISKFSLSDSTLALGRVRHAAENDDVSRSQPIVEKSVSEEPGKEQITENQIDCDLVTTGNSESETTTHHLDEFQETLHEYSVPDTTQNGPEKDSNAVFLTSDEATDERCLVGALVARIWTPQTFVSPFHRPPRKPPPEEIPGPEDVTPTSLTHLLRPPPEPPPDQISCILDMQFSGSRLFVT
jgi:hypothetical protein